MPKAFFCFSIFLANFLTYFCMLNGKAVFDAINLD